MRPTNITPVKSELRDAACTCYLLAIIHDHFTPSMKSVLKVFNNVRTNVISFLVFSNITFGSFEGQRRKLGAQTIAKLFTSIFVTRITSDWQNILTRQTIWTFISEEIMAYAMVM